MPTFPDYDSFRQRFLDTGEWLLGEQHCREALRGGDDPAAWQQLGIVLAHRSCKREAAAALSTATTLDPRSARTQYWLGKLADERGEFDVAAVHYARIPVHEELSGLREMASRAERSAG